MNADETRSDTTSTMNRYSSALLIGFAACVIGSFLPVFFWADPLFLLRVSALPTAAACLLLAWLSPRVHGRALARHLTAISIGYLSVVVAVSICAAGYHIARFGYGRTNVSGYFAWSWFYGAVFLPLSYPTALLILRATRPK
jgi:hypothetical protein